MRNLVLLTQMALGVLLVFGAGRPVYAGSPELQIGGSWTEAYKLHREALVASCQAGRQEILAAVNDAVPALMQVRRQVLNQISVADQALLGNCFAEINKYVEEEYGPKWRAVRDFVAPYEAKESAQAEIILEYNKFTGVYSYSDHEAARAEMQRLRREEKPLYYGEAAKKNPVWVAYESARKPLIDKVEHCLAVRNEVLARTEFSREAVESELGLRIDGMPYSFSFPEFSPEAGAIEQWISFHYDKSEREIYRLRPYFEFEVGLGVPIADGKMDIFLRQDTPLARDFELHGCLEFDREEGRCSRLQELPVTIFNALTARASFCHQAFLSESPDEKPGFAVKRSINSVGHYTKQQGYDMNLLSLEPGIPDVGIAKRASVAD